MKTENQSKRKQQIEAAAYALLQEKGYKATSMLAIAKKASASNETLYKWYGNKQTLFQSLVEENAREVKERLQHAIDHNDDAIDVLKTVGPKLLKLVTGEKAVILNRAAAVDVNETSTLGKFIATSGKQAVAPLLAQVMLKAREQGYVAFDEPQDITAFYISNLIGDLQIQRVIGVSKEPSKGVINKRSEQAIKLLLQVFTVN